MRHGAAPRVAATEIVITATGGASTKALTLRVRNGGEGAARADTGTSTGVGTGMGTGTSTRTGTGLARLRERLAVLYGNSATLTSGPVEGGHEAILVIPQPRRANRTLTA